MMDLEWIEVQCQYTEYDVKRIKNVCHYYGHRTIQSYVDKLIGIKNKHIDRLTKIPKKQIRRVKRYQEKVDMLEARIPMLQLMADTNPEKLYGNDGLR